MCVGIAGKRKSEQTDSKKKRKEKKYHLDLNTKVFIQDLSQEVPKPQLTTDRKLHLENNYCTFAFFLYSFSRHCLLSDTGYVWECSHESLLQYLVFWIFFLIDKKSIRRKKNGTSEKMWCVQRKCFCRKLQVASEFFRLFQWIRDWFAPLGGDFGHKFLKIIPAELVVTFAFTH